MSQKSYHSAPFPPGQFVRAVRIGSRLEPAGFFFRAPAVQWAGIRLAVGYADPTGEADLWQILRSWHFSLDIWREF